MVKRIFASVFFTIAFGLILVFCLYQPVFAQSLITNINTDIQNSEGEKILQPDLPLMLPVPRKNVDAIMNAVSEYVNEGKLSEEDYDRFCTNLTECMPKYPYHMPSDSAGKVHSGKILKFETLDINGRVISSNELFSGNKVTMLNIWDPYCMACITELPQLEKMSREYAGKGIQIVGLIYTADDADVINESKEIIDDLSLTYINLLPTKNLLEQLTAQSVPVTYFINVKGEVKGTPINGVNEKAYRERLDMYCK